MRIRSGSCACRSSRHRRASSAASAAAWAPRGTAGSFAGARCRPTEMSSSTSASTSVGRTGDRTRSWKPPYDGCGWWWSRSSPSALAVATDALVCRGRRDSPAVTRGRRSEPADGRGGSVVRRGCRSRCSDSSASKTFCDLERRSASCCSKRATSCAVRLCDWRTRIADTGLIAGRPVHSASSSRSRESAAFASRRSRATRNSDDRW
mmetsp:Transcript_40878/g.126235  ORF Transcript_40878/g.126235 Transcript_40878/m.126235 type:complete len:207 (+) Transcript_40878:428-1048(+)